MAEQLKQYEDYPLPEGPLKVEFLRLLKGANYFSGGPVVLIRLDLQKYDEVFSNEIDGFYEKLISLLPSLYEHHCSVGKPGGFLQRVREGTLLGHITEHVAIELQTLAGMDVGFGKTRSAGIAGVYNVVFRFFDEVAGVYAAKAAVNMINSILQDKDFDVFEAVEALILIREYRLLGPSTQAIVDEAEKRNIPWIRLDKYNLVQLGTGRYKKTIRATLTSDTDFLAVETADNKFLTTKILQDLGLPVLKTIRTDCIEEALNFFTDAAQPIVIKPIQAYSGKNTALDLHSKEVVTTGFQHAMEFEGEVLVQPFFNAQNYRLLVINYQFVAAVKLTPPFIQGDGKKTIKKLIDELNESPDRKRGDKGKLSKVEIDEITLGLLKNKGYDPESVLPDNEIFTLKASPNPRYGGISEDVTDLVCKKNCRLAEKATLIIGLNVAGVDVLAHDISKPLDGKNGIILELNAAPDFRMHLKPAEGKGRNVALPFINMLFPENSPAHIPLISVAGSKGTTLLTELFNKFLRDKGHITALNNQKGLFIGGDKISSDHNRETNNVELSLRDHSVDISITETTLKFILEEGLPYAHADIGVFVNLEDIYKDIVVIQHPEDIAYAMSVVIEQVYDQGWAVINADDQLIMENHNRLYSNVLLFSGSAENPSVKKHISEGGAAVYLSGKTIIINKDNQIENIDLPYSELLDDIRYDVMLAFVSVLHLMKYSVKNIEKFLLKEL